MAWYSSWTRAQQLVITVPAGTVAPLPYFPVVLTAASLPTELTNNTYGRSDGGDLAFAADLGVGNSVSSIGAQIPCEVVSAVFGVTPSAEIHVQVPSVAATGTLTYIWVLYGNSGQTAQPAAGSTYGSQKVWNENGTQNFSGVWHFGSPSSLNVVDSTSKANNGTNHGVTTGAGAWNGGGAATIGNGNYIDVGNDSSLILTGNFTLSSWANQTAAGTLANEMIARDTTNAPNRDYLLRMTTGGIPTTYVFNSISSNGLSGSAISFGTWCSVHATYTYIGNGTSVFTLYVNGLQVATTATAVGPPSGTATPNTWLGARNAAGAFNYFYGSIDEARIAVTARSASWIAAEYSNQSAPGTFIAASGSAIFCGSWLTPMSYTAWTRVQRLSITTPAGTTTSLSWFPVVLTAASLPTELTNNTYGRSDGGDLAFAADLGVGNSIASIGAQLPCEVVSAAFGVTPAAEIHVQVPSVAATGTLTYIWVLYGNSGQTAQPAASSTYGAQKVWNENGTQNYQGVWHLQGSGTPATWADSTSLNHVGTNHSATAATGTLGGCATFNGTTQYIDIGASNLYAIYPTTTQSTIGAWFKSAAATGAQYICSFQISTGSDGVQILGNYFINPYNFFGTARDISNNSTTAVSSSTYCDSAWHYSVWTINGANGTLYLDTANVASLSNASTAHAMGTAHAVIGSYQAADSFWAGSIDELRVSAVARSTSWIAAEYANQSAPGTFILPPGGQGPLPMTPATFMPWIFNSEDC